MRKEALQKGFTLIEVLVAVVILSIGLLGLAGMQMWAVKNTGNAFYRTQATLAANEMVERIRANPKGVVKGGYSIGSFTCPPPPPSCRGGAACIPLQLAAEDIFNVACGITGKDDGVGLDDLLPGGKLTINCPSDCTINIKWTEINGAGAVGTKLLELVITP